MGEAEPLPLPKHIYCLPAIFAITAFLLGFGGTSCHFLQFTTINDTADPPVTIHFGLWKYQSWNTTTNYHNETIIVEQCNIYPPQVTPDTAWTAARWFSILTFVTGGSFLFLNIIVTGCLATYKKAFALTAGAYVLSSLTVGLSLILLESKLCKDNSLMDKLEQEVDVAGLDFQETCSISIGGKCTIAAMVLWLAAGVMIGVLHPRKAHESGFKMNQTRVGPGVSVDDGLHEPLVADI